MTPRGAVLGFLAAAQKGEFELAAEYLNTRLSGKSSELLAKKLSVVLDRRLPARLNQLSDKPEGSQFDPLNPSLDLVGTIESNGGNVSILLERVDRGKAGSVWLFSSKTLELIPDLYEEGELDTVLPALLVSHRFLGIPLFEWLIGFVGLPLTYSLILLLNRLLGFLMGRLRRRLAKDASLPNPEVLPRPVRLLLVAGAIHLLPLNVSLTLLARQFWSSITVVLVLVSVVWILIRLNGRFERYVHRRLRRRNLAGTASVLRLARRVIDLILIFAGVLAILYYFGVNPTAAMAGLGVGGIAVALAAQKTLENVIGGASMIFDQVIRVGDTLKVGETVGTVEEIGLRSTLIRTFDRSVVSVPNGQIASMSLETVSARDKFWFHPLIGLGYQTTATEIRSLVNDVRMLLSRHAEVERGSVRVHFLGFGASSLDVDIFAYVYARDWNHFLEVQEGLLFSIMDIVQQSGVQLALPSRIMYFGDHSVDPAGTLSVVPKIVAQREQGLAVRAAE